MAGIQTTSHELIAGPWPTKIKLQFEGVVSATSSRLARNINQIHTLQADYPLTELPNTYSRKKNALTNIRIDDQYFLQLQPVYGNGYYEWEIHMIVNLPAGGADHEEIVFLSDPATDQRLDPNGLVDEWNRKIEAADTNLDFTNATITLNPLVSTRTGLPIGPGGAVEITEFNPPHGYSEFNADGTITWSPGGYDRYRVTLWSETELIDQSEVTSESYDPPTTGTVGSFDSGFDSSFSRSGSSVLLAGGRYYYRVEAYRDDYGYIDEYEVIGFDVRQEPPRGFDHSFDHSFG